jgi:DNA polymerase III subunit delta
VYPDEFVHNIDNGLIASAYLFLGDGDLLKEEAWNHLLAKVVPLKARQYNGERLLAKEHTALEVLGRLGALPMFGSRRLVLVHHLESWGKDQLKPLESYLAHPYPHACLVLSSSQKKGLERLQALVEKAGAVVQFSAPSERDAPRWLQMRARQLQKDLTPQAAVFLVEQIGADMYRLKSELEKLAAYVGERTTIALDDVKESVTSQRSFTVFELLRYVSQNQTKEAISSLRKLLLAGESPLGILALLARQVRILWQVINGLARKMPSQELSQKLALPPTVLRNYTLQAKLFSEAELYRIHQALRETDLALKSTSTAPQLHLEALVWKLCQREQKLKER